MTSVRPALALLWPSYTLFPLAGLAALVFGVVSHDGVLATIGFGFLALNALVRRQLRLLHRAPDRG